MIAYGDLRSWRADAVGRAGEQLRADLHQLELAADAVRDQAVPGSWCGLAWDPPEGVTRDDAREWRDDFDDYHAPEDDFAAYESQPVEADARASGAEYIDDLDADDLEHPRREAG